jgi:hypothetical protein
MSARFFALALLVTACVDNSGGDPPAGEPLEFALSASQPSGLCGDFSDRAWLVDGATDLDAIFADCEVDDGSLRDVVEAEVAALPACADAALGCPALVLLSIQVGGCIGENEIAGVYLDGTSLIAWVLQADSSYGKQNVACTTDIGQHWILASTFGVPQGASIELLKGVYNPELPGAPGAE